MSFLIKSTQKPKGNYTNNITVSSERSIQIAFHSIQVYVLFSVNIAT